MKTLLVRPGIEIVEKTLKGPWPPALSHLKKVYKEPSSLYRAFVQYATFSHSSSLAVGSILKKMGETVDYLDVPLEFGMPLTDKSNAKRHKKIAEYLTKGYDVVGISCTSSLEGIATMRIAETVKSVSKDTTVVVGGYQATAEAFDMMKKIPALDVIVLSDFEPIAEPLYAAFDGKIPFNTVPNILYRDKTIHASKRTFIKIEPEDLPVFDYSLAKKYIPQYSFFVIETSRGCLYNCSFCQESVLRQSYTVKDVKTAVNETVDTVNYIARFTEPVALFFCDALWGASPQWVKEFCVQLAARKNDITDAFGWTVEGRVNQFDAETLSLMKKAGCTTIGYGVESLSPKMLTLMNKTKNPEKYVHSVFETVEKTLKSGIHTALIFIFGMPGETPATVEETLHAIKKLPLENKDLHLKIGLPAILRGTALYNQVHDPLFVKEHGVTILDEDEWEKAYFPRYTMLFDPSKELSASKMTEIFLETVKGGYGLSASFGKQLGPFKDIKAAVDRDEISPEELAQLGKYLREIVTPPKRVKNVEEVEK